MAPAGRPTRPRTYLLLLCFSFVFLLGIHASYLTLPFFWDELGQFVPAALDILHDGAWVPKSTVPNVHPPGVMAYLALVWRVAGYSIPATRIAMLLAGAGLLSGTFLLAIELCQGLRGAPAFAAAVLLAADPLFYTQSMMAQLDMPAALFTVLALLFFLKNRHGWAVAACTALVLCKETGAIVPVILGGFLLRQPGNRGTAFWYALPFLPLAIWIGVLWRATGSPFGDPGFAHYNLSYPLHPVRIAVSTVRRLYYLFVDDFRLIGTIALVAALWRTRVFSTRGWRVVGAVFVAHTAAMSVLGGATLERYLLPALPILYIAFAAAWSVLRPLARRASLAASAAGLAACLFLNPPYPFPFENNLAMVDFVQLHQTAGQFLETVFPDSTIYSAWPLTAALRRPEFGFVRKGLRTRETEDLHASTLAKLHPEDVDVLVLYSRTWEPQWGALRWPAIQQFLRKFYDYEPQMDSQSVKERLGLVALVRWDQRGQWVEVYGRPHPRSTMSIPVRSIRNFQPAVTNVVAP